MIFYITAGQEFNFFIIGNSDAGVFNFERWRFFQFFEQLAVVSIGHKNAKFRF